MARNLGNPAFRQIEAIFVLGPASGLTDAQLVERFLARDGTEREDAFATLVHRHGPMVLRICRRMLSGRPEAEDAFQAVFLVLASKAGSLLSKKDLKSWLYGVAVRTAKEARRRSARLRAREGAKLDDSHITTISGPDPEGVLALLDEELERLHARYRDPLLLCELEGASRKEAAEKLGLPEGTVSSRLARGRALLRDRLAPRGVTLGVGTLAKLEGGPARAAIPESLVSTTSRDAWKFASGGPAAGSVPKSIASLAQGVLTMISLAKLKFGLAAATLIGATCLTTGLALGPMSSEQQATPEPSRTVAPPEVAKSEKSQTAPSSHVRGVVVDELGKPIAGAVVRAGAFGMPIADRELTGSDGTFALSIRRRRVDSITLRAHSAIGDRVGLFRYDFNPTRAEAEAPVCIVAKPGRSIIVLVADAAKAPVPGAEVEAAGDSIAVAGATTAPDGSARLLVPIDAKIDWIVALKAGRGFDYAEFGKIDDSGRPQGGIPAGDLPESVALTFEGSRSISIKAVDVQGKPLA